MLTVPGGAPAFLTHSRRLKRSGMLGRLTRTADPDTEHLTALVIGPSDVLVATHGEQRGTAVLHARLEDAEVTSLAGLVQATGASVEDDGISITGFAVSVEGGTGHGSFFVGLGAPDGDAGREALEHAIRAAKQR
jgi:hypothetical protein